jgi:hypothetical protein
VTDIHPEGGWEVEFRNDGPWKGQRKRFATEPDQVIDVPTEEGGPFRYRRALSVGASQSGEPLRLLYDPDPSMDPDG